MNWPPVAIASLTANLPAEIRSTLDALRVLVVATVPAVTERLNPDWRSIGFTHPRVDDDRLRLSAGLLFGARTWR